MHLLAEIVLIFLIYAVLGFFLEVVYVAATEGNVENRGFLAGPVVPIYAFGALAVLYLLAPVSRNPVWVFIGGALICSILEGVTGWALKKAFHRTWWDYSDKPFNLGGYICLQMSLLWGVACLLLVKVLEPAVQTLIGWMSTPVLYTLAGVGLLLFLIDFVTSLASAMHLRKIGPLDDVTGELRKVSDALSTRLGKDGLELGAKQKTADAHLAAAKEHVSADVAAKRAELQQRRADLLASEPRGVRRLRKAFPTLTTHGHH